MEPLWLSREAGTGQTGFPRCANLATRKPSPGRRIWNSLLGAVTLACFGVFAGGFPTQARAQGQFPLPSAGPGTTVDTPSAWGWQSSASVPAPSGPAQQLPGTVSGTVVDQTGAAVSGAQVTLTRGNESASQQALTGDDGHFSFSGVAPGPFELTISKAGFADQTSTGILQPGEDQMVPPVALAIATAVTEVRVEPPRAELAEIQVEDEEKQLVFGFIPNFYVSYLHDAVPLTPKQKFKLAWKSTTDPFTFLITGAAAGLEQGADEFGGYGQGAQGYAIRYAAAYGDLVTSTFIGSALLPSLLKQDPRYFYKGTGTWHARVLYALANAVICKGDNGHWQLNYSGIAGSLASGAISNAYYPRADREGAELMFVNAAIGMAESGAGNILQEFVIRKLQLKRANHNSAAKP
jgi:hypothetical protein